METQTEKFLKVKYSLDELEMEEPSINLVEKARQIVLARKAEPETIKRKWNLSFFKFEFTVLQAMFAALIIMWCGFYLTQKKYQSNYSASDTRSIKITSSKSNTVLASLTEYDAKSSVKSSTVLTSIITFIAKN